MDKCRKLDTKVGHEASLGGSERGLGDTIRRRELLPIERACQIALRVHPDKVAVEPVVRQKAACATCQMDGWHVTLCYEPPARQY